MAIKKNVIETLKDGKTYRIGEKDFDSLVSCFFFFWKCVYASVYPKYVMETLSSSYASAEVACRVT